MTAATSPTGRYYVDTTDTTIGDIDCIAVERVINGDRGPRPELTAEEAEFAARHMLARGIGAVVVAAAVGVPERTVAGWRDELDAGSQPRRRRGEPAPCGTQAAYRQHLRRGETPDDACRGANAAADRRLRTTGTSRAKEPA
ncbi:hypothetical protein OG216_09880 [Streptomycetaceae bacterium NBC_01309]